jgi:hypothetical protein
VIPIAVLMISMPAQHREHLYAPPQKSFTFSLESCSRSTGISVHVTAETSFTMSRNMQGLSKACPTSAAMPGEISSQGQASNNP